MKPDEFDRVIDKGDIGPLYFLYGDESYLAERAAKRLLDRLVPAEMRDFNLNVYYGNESSGDEIAESAQTLPMFADRRVVMVRHAEKLSAASMETLAAYFNDPVTTTCLIFLADKIDQRKKFFTDYKKKGELVEFKCLYENQLLPFLRSETAKLGKTLHPVAAEILVGLLGNNLQELVSQLNKIALYAGKKEKIEVADVEAVVSETRVDTVFELANSLGEKNLEKALRSLHMLLHDGEPPLLLLAMLARHFRQVWMVRERLDRKLPVSEIAKATGINPYFLQGIVRQAKNFDVAELKKIFGRFFDADLALKSGGKPALLLECLIIDSCGTQRRC